MAVQLIIKSAAQNLEDFKINCETSWTIAQVKDELTKVYPTKPTREQQKLIYGGKLLPDHLPLQSILNPTQDLHVLHLVCPVPFKTEPAVSNVNKTKKVSPACTVPPLDTSNIYPQVFPNQQLPTAPNFTNVTSAPVGTFALNTPADVVHQYLAMQQMYSQFMNQYFSQHNMAPPYAPIPATPLQQQPTVPAPQQQINNVNHNNNNNNNNAVQERWDLIDMVYIFSRGIMLVALLAYYSSPPRVIAVLVLVLLMSLFARINKDRQREVRAANERQRAAANTETEAQAETEENSETTNENSTAEQLSSPPEPTNVQRALSVPSTIVAFVVSFFTSLFPSDPAPVNVN